MLPPATSLSTQQIAEFLAVISTAPDSARVASVAAEQAARALEAEVGAVVEASGSVVSVGFPRGRVPMAALTEAARGNRAELDVPGAGRCRVAAASIGGPRPGHLLVARSGGDRFTVDEASLLRGMARVVELTLGRLCTLDAERRQAAENARLLAELRERHRLLEELSKIQRLITRQQPFQVVLDAITVGAAELLGDEMAGLRLRDPDDPRMMILHASVGVPADAVGQVWRVPVERAGLAGAAYARNEVVVMEQYPNDPGRVPALAAAGVASAMAAPVHDNGVVVGSLVVASSRSRTYTDRDRAVLRHFADHVSLAVSDHQTRAKMHAAYHDFLTGLASRALFMERLHHAVTGAPGPDGPAVLFVDLDRFKSVNDTMGHATGDALLVEVAQRLRSCLGPTDMPARLGGDEFAVLINEGQREQAVATAQRIIAALRRPFVVSGREVFVNASVGISFRADGHTGEDLVRNADLAMYEAKKNGKGRYEIFRADLQTSLLRTVGLEADLHRALARRELVLQYQPIVDLADGHVAAVEALVRWHHPERGLVLPGDFVPLAEETGLILPVGAWVLHEACRQAVEWPTGSGLTVSVNLSARQLQEPQLAGAVADTLAQTGLPPARLVVEITESLLLSDTAGSVAQLQRLKALGVRLAIDDFGTGYSSLAYLRHFPIDIIKIDRSFLDGAVTEPRAAALLQAIVQLGRSMGLTTVAEGIESPEQLAELRRAGCRLGQGYHFGAPLDPPAVRSLVTRDHGAPALGAARGRR